MGTTTYQDLIDHSVKELGVNSAVETVSGVLAQYCLDRLIMMVDGWNIRPSLIPWYITQTLPLVPNKQDYLIGSGVDAPDWDAPRPVKIEIDMAYVKLAQAGTPEVQIPIAVIDATEWAGVSIQQLQITFPQALYYRKDIVVGTNAESQPYTAGTITVWGIPTAVNALVLTYWHALTVGALGDNVNASPGYFRAMMLNLCLEISTALGVEPQAITISNAAKARAEIGIINKPNMEAKLIAPGVKGFGKSTYLTRAQFLSGQF